MLTNREIKELAGECGFELAGVTPAIPVGEFRYLRAWAASGFAGEMRYLTDYRGEIRSDPCRLLPSAKSIICVGKLYNGPEPRSAAFSSGELGWISRYAWGEDYHDALRRGLERMAERLRERSAEPFETKICVDTAPLLERAYARHAGLGWIGRNTCLINQQQGSWFFLGELLTSLEVAPDSPLPDRCGTCMRCVEACPTGAIVPVEQEGGPPHAIDSRLCISYLTIELRGAMPEERRAGVGNHVFGCDICQDVCPWNRKAPVTSEPAFSARHFAPPLEKLARISEREFREMFRGSPVKRARYAGFLRNVAVAMGNQRLEKYRAPLERLAQSPELMVALHAAWALGQMGRK